MLRPFLPVATLLVVASLAAAPAEAADRGMPASDGKPMLWAAPAAVLEDSGPPQPAGSTRYGFVDAAGRLVVPAEYSSYAYCADGDGRPAALLASTAEGSDLFDLSGELIGHLTAGSGECVGTDHAIVTQPTSTGWQAGVVQVSSGEEVLAATSGQRIAAMTASMVNVSRPDGEYFWDLATGATTRHPGWVAAAQLESGAPGVPATAGRASSGMLTGKYGYLGRGGNWVVPPAFDAAGPFRAGFAVIVQRGRATFLDAGLRRVGGEWDRIRPITAPATLGERVLGYWVEVDQRRALLGPDLQPIVQPGPGQIDCVPSAGGCAVVAPDGSADLVLFARGGATTLPTGFTQLITDGLVAARYDGGAVRVQSLASGRTITVSGRGTCRGVGTLFARCPGPQVIDDQGEVTEFTNAVAVPDPAGGAAYYWVTTRTEQGFLDPDGRWRFREPR